MFLLQKTVFEMIDVLINLIVILISRCIHTSKHQVKDFDCANTLFICQVYLNKARQKYGSKQILSEDIPGSRKVKEKTRKKAGGKWVPQYEVGMTGRQEPLMEKGCQSILQPEREKEIIKLPSHWILEKLTCRA